MRHERHLAQPPRALVGVEHLAEHLLARSRRGLDDAALRECNADLVDERAAISKRLRGRDGAGHREACGRREHLLGRDVRIAHDAAACGGGAAVPFVVVRQPDFQVGAGTTVAQRAKRRAFSSSVRRRSSALCAAQAATGSSRSTRDAAKIASHSRAIEISSGSPGNTARAQAGVAADTMVQFVAKPAISSRAGI
jgi:hypothetical protein